MPAMAGSYGATIYSFDSYIYRKFNLQAVLQQGRKAIHSQDKIMQSSMPVFGSVKKGA
jgi:hypothetical protein